MTLKVSVTFGTRPEAIKLAPVIAALRSNDRYECRVCVTAQHRGMLDQVLDVFGITPDVDLDLMQPGQSLTDLTCRALQGVNGYLQREQPDLVMVQGDTTTVFASALAAFYNAIPVAHVEAGLRTGNLMSPWPEEANRVLATRLTELHFAPTENARQNLLREGIPDDRIVVTGNTVIDALYIAVDRVRTMPPSIPELDPILMNGGRRAPLVLITGHRRESFGERLKAICSAIQTLAIEFPDTQFVYPVHLNPNVRSTVAKELGQSACQNIHLIEPLSYLGFVALMDRAAVIITDSGGVQEEAPALGKPVLVTRENTERPEALAGGTVKLVGSDSRRIVAEARRLLSDATYYQEMSRVQTPYGDGRATQRILNALECWSDARPGTKRHS